MNYYIVNTNAQPTSNDHEVHVNTCSHLPLPVNQLGLGYFNSCREAVAAAKKYYSDTNGCYYCSYACHTT